MSGRIVKAYRVLDTLAKAHGHAPERYRVTGRTYSFCTACGYDLYEHLGGIKLQVFTLCSILCAGFDDDHASLILEERRTSPVAYPNAGVRLVDDSLTTFIDSVLEP